MTSRRIGNFVAVVGIALLVLDTWSFWKMSQAQADATQAEGDAKLCERLALHIGELQAKPAVASTGEQATQEISRQIEKTAHGLGMTGENIASIEPDPPVRLGDSAYMEKPTTIQLRGVALPQLVNLLLKLEADNHQVRTKSLRLSTPLQKENGNLWSAEVTLTYLIYSPLPLPRS